MLHYSVLKRVILLYDDGMLRQSDVLKITEACFFLRLTINTDRCTERTIKDLLLFPEFYIKVKLSEVDR